MENPRNRMSTDNNGKSPLDEEKREQEAKIEKLLEECQGFKYTQSSNFSTLSRSIIFGIIGTLWIISYTDGEFTFPNGCSLYAMCAAFAYLIVDLIHYYLDSCFYKREYVQLNEEKSNSDAVQEHDKRMDKNADRSFYFFRGKCILLLITVCLFVIGFVCKYMIK